MTPAGIRTLRLFVGWPLPAGVRDEIVEALAPLRAKLPRASWTRPETYHVTFAFLGDHSEAVVPRLAEELDQVVHNVVETSVVARAPGFFPSIKRPRVGWIALEPAAALGEVAGRVRGAVRRAGLTMDEKPFASHLTLVRIREGWPPTAAQAFLDRLGPFETTAAPFGFVSLYSSRLEPSGAIHTELHRVDLRPSPAA